MERSPNATGGSEQRLVQPSMTLETPTRPILRYHGGKWELGPWIIDHFPPHRVYTEVYGGAVWLPVRALREPLRWLEARRAPSASGRGPRQDRSPMAPKCNPRPLWLNDGTHATPQLRYEI